MEGPPILTSIAPSTHDIGAFEVRRTLPTKGRIMVGPFIFVDAFGPARFDPGKGMDVRPHPHINLATVTYLFDGAIDHRDSLGTFATIEPGAVNLMTAGSGIVHSERSPAAERSRAAGGHMGRIYGMQTWLALPDGREEVDPAFEHIPADALPVIHGGGATARVIMGELWGAAAPTRTDSATIYADIRLDAGGSIPIDADADERALIVVGGDAKLDGEVLTCPWYGAQFDVRTGESVFLRSVGPLATHPTSVREGRVFVRLPVEPTPPTSRWVGAER